MAGSRMGDCITVLQANYRFRGPLAELAQAVRSGDADAVLAVLSAPRDGTSASSVRWLDVDVAAALTSQPRTRPVCPPQGTSAPGRGRGRRRWPDRPRRPGPAAPALCAPRGPAGASTWNARAEQWLADLGEGPPPREAGTGGGL